MSDINKSIKRRKRQHNMLKYEIICFNDETNEIIMQIKDDEKFHNFYVFLRLPHQKFLSAKFALSIVCHSIGQRSMRLCDIDLFIRTEVNTYIHAQYKHKNL